MAFENCAVWTRLVFGFGSRPRQLRCVDGPLSRRFQKRRFLAKVRGRNRPMATESNCWRKSRRTEKVLRQTDLFFSGAGREEGLHAALLPDYVERPASVGGQVLIPGGEAH